MATLVLKVVIFTLVAPCSVTVWIPLWLLGEDMSLPHNVWPLAGLAPIAWGAAIYVWCAWEFVRRGRGTPAPIDPPRQLVVSGLYRYVRNPMYVGLLSVLLGESLLLASTLMLGYAAVIWIIFHLWVVLYEEPVLRRQFGAAYEAYCGRVRRWIPSLRP